jgi:hypothetical protein
MQGLTLEDLKVAAGAIELGAQRGAYRANEFKVIGEIWEKLSGFIKAAVAEAEAAQQAAAASTPVDVETPADLEPTV